MPEPLSPQATPIENTGAPEWSPSLEDDGNAALSPSPERNVRWVFFGAEGLRAGWSLLLFVLLLALLGFGGTHLAHALTGARFVPRRGAATHPLTVWLYSHGVPFVAALAAAAILSRIERRPMVRYGLATLRGRAVEAVSGFVSGLLLFSLLVAVLWSQHLLVFDEKLLGGVQAFEWGIIWLLTFFCVALSEEYLTRGYVQFTLARGLAGVAGALGMADAARKRTGFWCAALFFSFIFGLGHTGNPGESPVGIWAAGLIGLVFAFSLWRTGSLWWAVCWHAAWDWAESFLFGTADSGNAILHPLWRTHPQGATLLSGGLTGPEGSVYVLGIIALTALLIGLLLKPQSGSASMPETWPTRD